MSYVSQPYPSVMDALKEKSVTKEGSSEEVIILTLPKTALGMLTEAHYEMLGTCIRCIKKLIARDVAQYHKRTKSGILNIPKPSHNSAIS
jgi:hypothetical protein